MGTIRCVKCGHNNALRTERSEVRVVDLTPQDVGLQVQIHGRIGPLTAIHPDGADQPRALFAISATDRNAEWNEPDSWTSYFYKPEDTITIWRPIND